MALLQATPRDIITLALKDAGVVASEGQTPSAGWMNDGLTRLNWLLMQWQVKRWLVYRLVTWGVTATGAVSYTIGPGGNIEVAARPERIEAAFLRQLTQAAPNQADTPLALVQSRESYNNLATKQTSGSSNSLFYDNAWPLGVLYPWPVPQATLYALHVSVKLVVGRFENLADDCSLPEEYYNALRWSLAVELREAAGLPASALAVALAKSALNTLRGANAQVAVLQMPAGLPGSSGRYDVFSDQGR